MSKFKKDHNSLEINRIVSFTLSEDNSLLQAVEECDSYFQEDLTKNDVDELIKALQDLRDKMI